MGEVPLIGWESRMLSGNKETQPPAVCLEGETADSPCVVCVAMLSGGGGPSPDPPLPGVREGLPGKRH